jgi:hypothetical protein
MAKSKIFFPIGKPVDSDGLTMMKPERVIHTRGLWSDSSGELINFFTSSMQNSTSKTYYYEIWSKPSVDCDVEDMFSIAYGNINGSGSVSAGGDINDTPSRAIYSQYKLKCLERGETFVLGDNSQMNHFYVVNFNRDRMGDKLDPGNFQLNLKGLNGASFANNVFTGSNVLASGSGPLISLIDDSGDKDDSLGYGGIPSPVRNLVSGTIEHGIHNPSAPHYYGLVYSDTGAILISADVLNTKCFFNTVTGSNLNGDNAYKLFTSISGASSLNSSGFVARAVEVKEQDYYFVRVDHGLMNYSTNPTFISGSDSFLSNKRFRNEPVTYVTSIGLYDDIGNLLAIAKMNKPIQKSFNSELSVTIKLEY